MSSHITKKEKKELLEEQHTSKVYRCFRGNRERQKE
jgi:hypothetical protein